MSVVRRGFKCRREVYDRLIEEYEKIVFENYGGDYLSSLQDFERISEGVLRGLLVYFMRVVGVGMLLGGVVRVLYMSMLFISICVVLLMVI